MSAIDELRNFDKAWPGIDSSRPSYDPLPDGTYQTRLENLEFVRDKEENLRLVWTFRVLAGEQQGRQITRRNGFDNIDRVTFLKKDLAAFGVDIPKLSDLPKIIPSLIGKVVEVRLKSKTNNETGKTYQNSFINKVLEGVTAPGQTSNGADLSDIDIDDDGSPF